MSDRAWPTAAELDAKPELWGRWWWVNGAPERLGVDRMTHPARVTWRARFVDELPVEWFGGVVMTAEEADALRASAEIPCRSVPFARIPESEWPPDELPPHCIHAGYGGHQPWHGWQVEHRLSPDEREIERLQGEVARLTARVAELEAPGECASIHKLQAKLSEVTAERDRLAEELEAERSGEVCGMLADLCDILFEDKERAATHGYEGVVDKAREVVAERDRYKAGCEHYLERAETVRHLMTVGEDVVGTLHRMASEYVQVSFSRWRWRRMVTDGVPNDTERVLRREWLVSDDRAILVAAFGADVVAKVEAS